MENAEIRCEVNGRVKHFFSIYKKMLNQHKTLDQIYDIFAVRIIVDSVKDCYAALGVIHENVQTDPRPVLKIISRCRSRICISPYIRH